MWGFRASEFWSAWGVMGFEFRDFGAYDASSLAKRVQVPNSIR